MQHLYHEKEDTNMAMLKKYVKFTIYTSGRD